jgi:DNA polymerase gamma 1
MKIKGIRNELGYLAIDDQTQQALFGVERGKPTLRAMSQIRHGLKRFGMELPQMEEAEIDGPDLTRLLDGLTARQYLEKALEPYRVIDGELGRFARFETPVVPARQTLKNHIGPGWTRFAHDGPITKTDGIQEETMIGDLETYVKMGSYPVMMGGLTDQAYYLWLHPCLIGNTRFYPELVSIGPKVKNLVNHNVTYDAIRIKEFRNILSQPNMVCTMAMHIAYAGMGNQQRVLYGMDGVSSSKWKMNTCPNGLIDTYNFYVRPFEPLTKGDKTLRDIFVVGDVSAFRANLLDLVTYCLRDCQYTHELFCQLYPLYRRSNPELFTLGGHIQINSEALPVVGDWDTWVERVESIYLEVTERLKKKLTGLAHNLGAMKPEDAAEDPWLSQLDWTPAKSGKNKGAPLWYRKAVLSSEEAFPVGISSRLAPLLLRMTWNGKPLYHTRAKGWCYILESDTPNSFNFEGKILAKVPHPKGDKNNVGSPLAKDFVGLIDRGVLGSEDKNIQKMLEEAHSVTYWSSMRSRVKEILVWPAGDMDCLMVKPGLVTHGTVSRRKADPIWATCCDLKPKVVGSELKSRIQAPLGWVFVGSDHDQQEMKIGAALADHHFGFHGSSPMSLTQMLGDKDQQTDSHSLLAKSLDLWPDRQLAKTLNFLMLFFGGQAGLFEAIKTALPDLTDAEANDRAKKALNLRRGRKNYETGLYEGGTDSYAYNYMIMQANTEECRTPLGRSATSLPLRKGNCGNDFMPSRCNRSIQSSGADLLHVFVCLLDHFIKKLGIQGRFIFSYHDEQWSIVREEDANRMANVFQLCHILTWSLFYESVGFDTIPFNYLFFSSVNVDRVIRKEVTNSWKKGEGYIGTRTPSNPDEQIPEGYYIKPKSMTWEI